MSARAGTGAGLLALVVAGALAGCAGSGGPPAAGSAPLATPLATADLAERLAAAGLDAVRLDDVSVVLKGDGVQLLVFVEDGGESLQAVLPYIGRASGDPTRIAAWNASRRFGRAYLDEDSAPVLASDLLLGPAVGVEAIATWCRLLLPMAVAFRDEVWP